MLVGFREGVKEGTFHGKHLVHIAMGLQFLDNMVRQAQMDVELVKRQEKQMVEQAKQAIKEAGGQMKEDLKNGSESATPTPAA